MKQINSFLCTFIFGLPFLFIISFCIWILLLVVPEKTHEALTTFGIDLAEKLHF